MEEKRPKFHPWFHNFMIYFAMWAYALIAVIGGIREIIFADENEVRYKVVVIALAVLLILLGGFIVKVRFDLAAFRPGVAKALLGVCLAAAAILLAIYLLLYIGGADDSTHRLTMAFIFACWGIALYRYYNDRPYLFEK